MKIVKDFYNMADPDSKPLAFASKEFYVLFTQSAPSKIKDLKTRYLYKLT